MPAFGEGGVVAVTRETPAVDRLETRPGARRPLELEGILALDAIGRSSDHETRRTRLLKGPAPRHKRQPLAIRRPRRPLDRSAARGERRECAVIRSGASNVDE